MRTLISYILITVSMKVVHVIKYMGGIERKFGWPVYLNVVLHRFSSAYGTIKPLAKTEFLFILVMILSVGNPLIFLISMVLVKNTKYSTGILI